jgi:A/G-specific adenine glycosylase
MSNGELNISFSRPLLSWFDEHGRKNLPWQHPRTAYRVWIAEIMLQQTQVQTVIPYFERFIASFPDIKHLNDASEDSVLAHWSGLGYYSRARNIHKTAKIIWDTFQGEFPKDLTQLMSLPGIGATTAAAIASQAFNQPTPILDGNVIRVLTRYFMVEGWPMQGHVKKQLWQLADQCMSRERCRDYTQAIMDLGATCCTRSNPNCQQCPLQKTCLARKHNKIALYPFKKIKKSLPVKHQKFLLLHTANNEIYLEKNPPQGLWGGLWCLPATDLNCNPVDFIHQNYGFDCLDAIKLPEIKHSFSHFHLHIQPLAFHVKPQHALISENSGRWFNTSEFNSIGLATPVSKIINQFLLETAYV